MVRHDLSQPVAILVRHGLIKLGVQVFDYGCGQGDDLRILGAAGIDAAGWDPHFRPDAERTSAAVVNLGFVLNVIEDPAERRHALSGAWALTEKILAVATMIAGQVPVGGLRPHGDGFVTSRGTFQKYFQHGELRALIGQTLGVEPVAMAPGIFFVFRAPEDEQEFLLNRRLGRRNSTAAYRTPREPRQARPKRPALPDRIPISIGELASFMRQRGRAPQPDELSAEVHAELAEQKVSLLRAIDACLETVLPQAEVQGAAAARREDLLVHYALGLLNRSASANRPSPAMVRDIRTHFGSQKEVMLQATQFLHGLADEARVREAMQAAADQGLGILDHRDRLIVNGDRADDLPGLLRCYFGCATFLSGEPQDNFVLRIDATRRRVAMWPLPDLSAPFPETEISVRIDLRRQDVHVRPDRRRLLAKSQLLAFGPGSKQRDLEIKFRGQHGLEASAVWERLDQRP